jgi:hypothetical protein
MVLFGIVGPGIPGLLLDFDLYRQIRATKLAQLAAYTILGPRRHDFFDIVQFQDLFGAKLDANAASLAPFPSDRMFLQFWFGHRANLSKIMICKAISV